MSQNKGQSQVETQKTKSQSFKGKAIKKGCLEKFFECGCLVRCNAALRKKLKPVEVQLENRGEIVYIGGSIPAIFFFILSMITGGIYVKEKSVFKACQAVRNAAGEKERIDEYLLGALILQYVYVLQYMNMIFEVYKPLANILSNFIFMVVFLIASLVWTIIGTAAYSSSECSSTAYYNLSLTNVIINYIIIGGLLIYSIVIMIIAKTRKNKQAKAGKAGQPGKQQPQKQPKAETPANDQQDNQSQHQNQGSPQKQENQNNDPVNTNQPATGQQQQEDPYGVEVQEYS